MSDFLFFYLTCSLSLCVIILGVLFSLTSLYVIMQDLDPQVMKIFSQEMCESGLEATQTSGIDKLIPGANIDEFLFTPCGYSMNGYIKGVS